MVEPGMPLASTSHGRLAGGWPGSRTFGGERKSLASSLVRAGQAEFMLGQVIEDHLLRHRCDAHQARLTPITLDVILARISETAVGLDGSVGSLVASLGG